MAKKVKRQVRSSAGVSVEYTPSSAASMSPSRPGTVEFNPDYTHVIGDLRRIGILAGSFFVILVALSFILPLIIR